MPSLLRDRPVTRVRTIAGDVAWLVSSHALCKRVLEDDRFSLKETSAPGVPRQYALTIPSEVVNNDVRLGDVTVRRGELVLVLVEAVNHDPAQYDDPRAIRLDRPNAGTHLSFGGGGHYCPATALGKKHAEVALRVLLDRMPRLDLAVPVEQLVWRTGFMKRIPERLPVRW
ncbi:cytochrome P450 [Streptomyces sp. NPDC001595]|uniref:cytochrome P450 n=1 Tax=Streptomyces sp. NPDC001532 TaxID=3154520 RepID=UPI00332BC4B4